MTVRLDRMIAPFSGERILASGRGSKPTLFELSPMGEIAMHFCLTGQYTPQALNSIMDSPTTSRYEAAKNLMEAAGGKLIAMYSTAADGPGVLVIVDVPDPGAAPAISGVVVASGALHHVKLTRLWTQDEIMQVRQTASKLRSAYKPPGK
jgi:uncharacterized protein with GYD domain